MDDGCGTVGADDPGSPLYGQPLSHASVTAMVSHGRSASHALLLLPVRPALPPRFIPHRGRPYKPSLCKGGWIAKRDGRVVPLSLQAVFPTVILSRRRRISERRKLVRSEILRCDTSRNREKKPHGTGARGAKKENRDAVLFGVQINTCAFWRLLPSSCALRWAFRNAHVCEPPRGRRCERTFSSIS